MQSMYESSKKKKEKGGLGVAFLVKMYYDVEKGVFTPVNKEEGSLLRGQKRVRK